MRVQVEGPLLLGFVPPVTEAEVADESSGVSQGIEHVEIALETTKKCLNASGLDVEARLVFATALTIALQDRVERKEFPQDSPENAGVYLLAPGRKPRLVSAGKGPSSLIYYVPREAAAFFGASACKGSE